MVRIGKMTDYAIVLLTYMARPSVRQESLFTARDLSERSKIPLPTVTKILKLLTQGKILTSQRGVKGGYLLAKEPRSISVVEIVNQLEGPLALTVCTSHGNGGEELPCEIESICPNRSNWQKINATVVRALSHLTLEDMLRPLPRSFEVSSKNPKMMGASKG